MKTTKINFDKIVKQIDVIDETTHGSVWYEDENGNQFYGGSGLGAFADRRDCKESIFTDSEGNKYQSFESLITKDSTDWTSEDFEEIYNKYN